MSGSVNKAILIGNLGRDPEIRRTRDGKPVATLSVATSDTWRDKATGERKEKTEWHRVVVFLEAAAKFAEQYLKKGQKVMVEGSIKSRKWEDKDGVEKYTTEIVLSRFNHNLISLERGGDGGNRVPPADDPESYGKTTTKQGARPQRSEDDFDSEIPF